MIRFFQGACLLLLATVFSFQSAIAEEYYADYEHKGVVSLEDGMFIFPENRNNNALYDENNNFLFTATDKIILTAKKNSDLIVYAYSENGSATKLNYFPLNSNNIPTAFIENNALIVDRNNTNKEVFFINKVNLIESFFVKFKSAAGFEFDGRNAIFYYVKEMFKDDENANSGTYYLLNVMYADLDTGAFTLLKRNIKSDTTQLKLQWIDQNTITYKLQNGQSGNITFNSE